MDFPRRVSLGGADRFRFMPEQHRFVLLSSTSTNPLYGLLRGTSHRTGGWNARSTALGKIRCAALRGIAGGHRLVLLPGW